VAFVQVGTPFPGDQIFLSDTHPDACLANRFTVSEPTATQVKSSAACLSASGAATAAGQTVAVRSSGVHPSSHRRGVSSSARRTEWCRSHGRRRWRGLFLGDHR